MCTPPLCGSTSRDWCGCCDDECEDCPPEDCWDTIVITWYCGTREAWWEAGCPCKGGKAPGHESWFQAADFVVNEDKQNKKVQPIGQPNKEVTGNLPLPGVPSFNFQPLKTETEDFIFALDHCDEEEYAIDCTEIPITLSTDNCCFRIVYGTPTYVVMVGGGTVTASWTPPSDGCEEGMQFTINGNTLPYFFGNCTHQTWWGLSTTNSCCRCCIKEIVGGTPHYMSPHIKDIIRRKVMRRDSNKNVDRKLKINKPAMLQRVKERAKKIKKLKELKRRNR